MGHYGAGRLAQSFSSNKSGIFPIVCVCFLLLCIFEHMRPWWLCVVGDKSATSAHLGLFYFGN